MEKEDLLLEYLKEHYTQARQHETLRTNATALLTAAAGVVLGLMVKDGRLEQDTWWIGLIISLIGIACWQIQEAHFTGNRFHTTAAGLTRNAIEDLNPNWRGPRTSAFRHDAMIKLELPPGAHIGHLVHKPFRFISAGLIVLGVIAALAARCPELLKF